VAAPRPRRSALYVPGANARALGKARGLPADVVILDLEDAVAPGSKDAARTQVLSSLLAEAWPAERVIRVNGAGSPWGADDLRMAAGSGADAVCLPKAESPEAILAAAEALERAGAPASLALWAMIETPRGVLAAHEIAAATPSLACLVAGTSDLTKELRARHTPGRAEVLASLSLILLAARSRGLVALDGVFLDLADAAGLEASCRQGRDLGFEGKTLIHPSQLEPANRIFAPSVEELDSARRVVAAHAEAVAGGRGVAVVDGRLIEALHVAEAERVLALAEAIARRASP
jgi:citrate lyase subunit beta / citryl-CoA lyase